MRDLLCPAFLVSSAVLAACSSAPVAPTGADPGEIGAIATNDASPMPSSEVGSVDEVSSSDARAAAEDAAEAPKGPHWVEMASAPTGGRQGAAYVWTGSKMIVWGGETESCHTDACWSNDGYAYEPATDTWSLVPPAPVKGRAWARAVWTGHEMVVWGGAPDWISAIYQGGGAAYDPVANTWRKIPNAPLLGRVGFSMEWSTTTKEMIIWGGDDNAKTIFEDGAAYDPASDTWRKLAKSPLGPRAGTSTVWNGSKMVFFGGWTGSGTWNDAASYDPKSDTWSTLPPPGLSPRSHATGVATGNTQKLATFFGGSSFTAPSTWTPEMDGATWDDEKHAWTKIPAPTKDVLPAPTRDGAAVWWGAGALYVWGGRAVDFPDYLGNGASFDPSSGLWSPMPKDGAPSARAGGCIVSSSTEAILFSSGQKTNTGKRYRY